MKVALADQPNLDFAVPAGMSLLPTTSGTGETVTEAFKPGQTPGAQTTDSLLAGDSSGLDSPATPASQSVPGAPGTAGPPGAPAASPPANIDKSLGGLY
jgi:penicillin-binding protein 1A